MAPSPPTPVDQTVPGSTPSRRRVTRDGVIHSGWGWGAIAAGLPALLFPYQVHACYASKKQPQDHYRPQQTTEPQTDQNPPPEKPTRTKTRNEKNTEPAIERRKKKTGAGRGLGVGDEHGVRVEDEVHGQDAENARGNPNPKWGLGFPRERKREKRRRQN